MPVFVGRITGFELNEPLGAQRGYAELVVQGEAGQELDAQRELLRVGIGDRFGNIPDPDVAVVSDGHHHLAIICQYSGMDRAAVQHPLTGRRGIGRVPDLGHAVTYITWEQYENNVRRLKQHRRHGPVPGPARGTVALLAGLVVCGQCGCRMQTRYTQSLRYDCQRRAFDYAAPHCESLAGAPLEQLVRDLVLEVVTPASLELSVHAAQECERERAAVDRQWQLRLERAAQEANRAFRQYNAVEPENRLVARTLERTWEEALLVQRTLEEEYRRFQKAQPVRLSAAERDQIETLARDLPALWHASQTSLAEKRQIVRRLLQAVVVWAPASTQEVKVQLHWAYGTVTEHQVLRPVAAWKQVSGAADLWRQVREWQAAGWTSRRVAEALNKEGHRTPHGQPFTAESVRKLTERGGPDVPKTRKAPSQPKKKSRIGGSATKTNARRRPEPSPNGRKPELRPG